MSSMFEVSLKEPSMVLLPLFLRKWGLWILRIFVPISLVGDVYKII
jgi:hypothetical protein